jgi:hypothetical protein
MPRRENQNLKKKQEDRCKAYLQSVRNQMAQSSAFMDKIKIVSTSKGATMPKKKDPSHQ